MNQPGHGVCWMLTGRNNGLKRGIHTGAMQGSRRNLCFRRSYVTATTRVLFEGTESVTPVCVPEKFGLPSTQIGVSPSSSTRLRYSLFHPGPILVNEHDATAGSLPSLPREVVEALRAPPTGRPLAGMASSPRPEAWGPVRIPLPVPPLAGRASPLPREAWDPLRVRRTGRLLVGKQVSLLREAWGLLRVPSTGRTRAGSAWWLLREVWDPFRVPPTGHLLAGRASSLRREVLGNRRAPSTTPPLDRARQPRRPPRAETLSGA